jgi:hypothetical protein
VVRHVSVQERLRGWRRGSLLFGRRSRVDSRGQLTRGRMEHSSGHGDVLSPCASTTSGMALQCPVWRRGGGDGRTGLMVTEGTRPMSRHGPVRARNGRPSPFEGSSVLFRGCSAPAVQEWVAQCRGAKTVLAAQYRTMAGVASPGLAEQHRDMTPRRVRGTACTCRC